MKFLKFSLLLLLVACTETQEPEKDVFDNPIEKPKQAGNEDFETRMKREVENKLSISSTEKYKMEIAYAQLNNDDVKDAVITVNRLDFAINEASKTANPAKRAELGYMGAYNHFFFYDGASDQLSIPIAVPSSAKAPLEVAFENIQSEFYKDITIQYRIRNSAFKNYYLLENNQLQLMFQWKIFDQVGLDNYEANYITFAPGSISLAKDILIYKGVIKNYSKNIPNVYAYKPEITKTDEKRYQFFYDPKERAYMTQQKP